MPVIIHDKTKLVGLQGKATGGSSNHGASIDHRHSSLGIAQLLFYKINADMNVATDQIFSKAWDFGDYIIDEIRAVNASISLTTAVGGIYDTVAKGGSPLVAAAQVWTALTGPTKGVSLAISADGKDRKALANLYLSLTTPQGAAATADIYVFGYPLTEL